MTQFVTGVDQVRKKLKAVEQSVQPKLVSQSARAALVPTRKQAMANAPKGKTTHRTYKGRLVAPGFLKRNIKLRKMKFRDKGRVGYSLAARGEAWYGKLAETGFTHRGGKDKQGKATKVDGDPWLGSAFETTKNQIQSRFIRELMKRIEKAKRK